MALDRSSRVFGGAPSYALTDAAVRALPKPADRAQPKRVLRPVCHRAADALRPTPTAPKPGDLGVRRGAFVSARAWASTLPAYATVDCRIPENALCPL
jgi:hypothetical protein